MSKQHQVLHEKNGKGEGCGAHLRQTPARIRPPWARQGLGAQTRICTSVTWNQRNRVFDNGHGNGEARAVDRRQALPDCLTGTRGGASTSRPRGTHANCLRSSQCKEGQTRLDAAVKVQFSTSEWLFWHRFSAAAQAVRSTPETTQSFALA